METSPEISEKPTCQPPAVLEGIHARLHFPGAIVEDIRSGKPRFVGLIVPLHTHPGWTLCPFVQEKIVFDVDVPNSMRSPEKAIQWVKEHAVAWNDRYDYNHLKYLGTFILFFRKWQRILMDIRLQVGFLQLLLSILIPSVYIPLSPDMVTYIVSGVISFPLFVLAVIRIGKVIKDFNYKEKY